MISGGTKGIGKAIIKEFAQRGFSIATFARSQNGLDKLKAEIEKEYEVEVYTEALNVDDKEGVNGFAQRVLSKFSKVDVLVNNAGFFEPGMIGEEEDGVLERTLQVNLNGSYYLSRAFMPSFKEHQHGHIFNICSIASITAYTNGGSYCISKYALLGFSRVLREEMKAFNVAVTAMLPGATYTDSWASSGIPEERFMKPEDVGKSVFDIFSVSKSTVIEEVILRPMQGDI